MKVLFLTNIPSPYRVAFFQELGKLCDLTVLYEKETADDRNEKWMESSLKKEDTYRKVFLKAVKKGVDNAFCPSVIRYIKDRSFDEIIVGVYSTQTGMYAIQYMKRHNIPYWISCDGGMAKNEGGLKYKIKSFFLSGAKGYFSPSQVSDQYLMYYGARKESVFRYPFTSLMQDDILERTVTHDEKSKLRKKLHVTEEIVLLSVGQFIHRKGYDLLLKAMKEVNESVEKLRKIETDQDGKEIGLYIVGDHPTEEYLSIQKELGLTNVHFVAFKRKEELAEYYKMADLFVLPTREDIWGLVINEAMAKGLPVVTTDKCVAGLELIQNGMNGQIVKSDDIPAIKDAVLFWANQNKNARNRAGEKSLQEIKAYSIEKMAQKYWSIIDLNENTGDR